MIDLIPVKPLESSGKDVREAYQSLAVVERWARRLTGIVFVGERIYMTLVYTLGIQL